MQTEEHAVRETHAAWIAAVNAGDLDRLLASMTDDASLLSPGEAPIGRDGFAANFTAAKERIRFRCASEIEDVVVAGDVAYTQCRDSLSVTPHSGGDTVRYAGHRLTVYRRQPDGRWLLARDAHTLSPVAN